jgi:hypothetical protein
MAKLGLLHCIVHAVSTQEALSSADDVLVDDVRFLQLFAVKTCVTCRNSDFYRERFQ